MIICLLDNTVCSVQRSITVYLEQFITWTEWGAHSLDSWPWPLCKFVRPITGRTVERITVYWQGAGILKTHSRTGWVFFLGLPFNKSVNLRMSLFVSFKLFYIFTCCFLFLLFRAKEALHPLMLHMHIYTVQFKVLIGWYTPISHSIKSSYHAGGLSVELQHQSRKEKKTTVNQFSLF